MAGAEASPGVQIQQGYLSGAEQRANWAAEDVSAAEVESVESPACSPGCSRHSWLLGARDGVLPTGACTSPAESSTVSPLLGGLQSRQAMCELRSELLLGFGPGAGHMPLHGWLQPGREVGAHWRWGRRTQRWKNTRALSRGGVGAGNVERTGKEIHPGQSSRQRLLASLSSRPAPASSAASARLTCRQGWRPSRAPLCCVGNCSSPAGRGGGGGRAGMGTRMQPKDLQQGFQRGSQWQH